MTRPTDPGQPRHAGIGAALRQARADRGLSLTELQARTKVRARFLAALEDERFQDLPPYVFARGFLHAAAQELGLDPEPLVNRLSTLMAPIAESSAATWRRLDAAVIPAVPPSRFRRMARTAGAIGVVGIAILAIFFAQQLRQLSEPAQGPTPDVEPAGSGPTVAAGPQEAPGAAPQTAEPPSSPAASGASPAPSEPPGAGPLGAEITLELEATGRSWLLVAVDETPVFEGFVGAGDSRRWAGKTAIRVRVGNAGAITLVVNGKAFRPLGLPGEVVDRTFSKEEIR